MSAARSRASYARSVHTEPRGKLTSGHIPSPNITLDIEGCIAEMFIVVCANSLNVQTIKCPLTWAI